jgi:integrase
MTWDEIEIPWAKPRPFSRAAALDRSGFTDENGREHRVPLTAEAVALLESLPRMDSSPYVFFAPRGGMLSDMTISAVMRRMQEAEEKAGRPGYLDPRTKRPAVPHGLRSTFRQWTAEQGYPRDMAEIALAHLDRLGSGAGLSALGHV